MTKLAFSKMHGLGNDFVMIDAVRQDIRLSADQVRWLADRHFGVGCDQLLVVEPAQTPGVDFRYRIFNADGSEVEQCGNGARCFARFVLDKRLTTKKVIRVETKSGIIELRVQNDGQVCVNMGAPRLQPEQVPFQADQAALTYRVDVEGQSVELAVRSAGAYGFVMSSNYNTRGRAAEVLVDGEQAYEVRRRETVQELYAGESLLPA